MTAYILLKFWFKVYWGLSSGVIMVLHQNQQKLTQEDAGVSYIPFLQPVIRLKAVGVQEKSKESWKQFLLWKNLGEQRCSFWPEKYVFAKKIYDFNLALN